MQNQNKLKFLKLKKYYGNIDLMTVKMFIKYYE